jgi:hypothetical protein
MYKQSSYILFIILISSGCDKPKPNGFTNELLTLTAKNPDNVKSLKYKWTISEQPDGSNINLKSLSFSEDKSSIYFTPDVSGHYNFRVSVSWYGEVISIQSFPLLIEQKNESSHGISQKSSSNDESSWDTEDKSWLEDSVKLPKSKSMEPTSKKPIPQKPELKNTYVPPENTNYYTIQVAAKKDKKSAEIFMKQMQEKGFNAYIQRYNNQNTDELWFRIRVGSYTAKDSAKLVANKINSSMSLNTWIDYVRK